MPARTSTRPSATPRVARPAAVPVPVRARTPVRRTAAAVAVRPRYVPTRRPAVRYRRRSTWLTPRQRQAAAVAGGVLALLVLGGQHEGAGPAVAAPAPPAATGTPDSSVAAPSTSAADIPAEYLALYRQSGGACSGLDWALLAGVGKIETDHGRARLPGVRSGTNYAGAAGPMQFLLPTFSEVRGKYSDVGSDIYAPENAIPAAAHYLCDGGLAAGRGVRTALWTYNHSSSYADAVLAAASRYRAADAG